MGFEFGLLERFGWVMLWMKQDATWGEDGFILFLSTRSRAEAKRMKGCSCTINDQEDRLPDLELYRRGGGGLAYFLVCRQNSALCHGMVPHCCSQRKLVAVMMRSVDERRGVKLGGVGEVSGSGGGAGGIHGGH